MNKLLTIVLLLSMALATQAQQRRPIGTNLTSVNDYSTEFVFTDAFKQSRRWITHNANNTGPWDTRASIPTNAQGYPTRVPFNSPGLPPQKVRTLMVWELKDKTPKGRYRLIVKGKGRVKFSFGATGEYACPVDTYVQVNGQVALTIEASDPKDPIRDIKFIYPKYASTFQGKAFTDEFKAFVKDFSVLRFMDWAHTNNSKVRTWQDRAKRAYYTQAQANGVAWEYAVQLCNETNKSAWVNIPHNADNGYIWNLAHLLKTRLNPWLKVYLEYSNEVWNGQFAQHQEAAARGASLGYAGPTHERAWQYTAKRSADIFDIFTRSFGGGKRLVKVIPSQAGNPHVGKKILGYFNNPRYNPKKAKADVLAIAPYFAGKVADQIVAEGRVGSITVPQIIARMRASIGESLGKMDQNGATAKQYGVGLVAYEGGQHLVGRGNNVNNDALTRKLNDANRHWQMRQLYCQYFNHWYTRHGGLFAHFSSHGKYGRYGSWGVKEYMDDTDNGKYQGLKACVFAHNNGTARAEAPLAPQNDQAMATVYPNPSENGVFHIRPPEGGSPLGITVYDLAGQAAAAAIETNPSGTAQVRIAQKGAYIIKIQTKNTAKAVKVIHQ